MAAKFYAVRQGIKPGVYRTWDEAKSMVHGYKGAEYKSFPTEKEALEYVNKTAAQTEQPKADAAYAYVDGSFNVATGVYGYGGFLCAKSSKYLLSGCGDEAEMASMRNVAGEILGSMAAIAKALELGLDYVEIYYDYQGISSWANGDWKRNKKGTMEYYDYIQSVKDRITIKFVKVKGHSGVEGNEEADRLAKAAVGIV